MRLCFHLLIALIATPATAATLNGSALALKSDGQSASGAYVLDRNGYVGTYITLAAPGAVQIDVNAEGSGGAMMGLAVGDSRASFSVPAGAKNYRHSLALPAGTHFIRTELNNDRGVDGRQLRINNLTVTGAEFANANSNSNALAASDTYIANYRRGNASVAIASLTAGQQVAVSLKRIDFDFGAGAAGDSLRNLGNVRRQRYQAALNQNFNTIVCQCYWESNEPNRGQIQIGELGVIRDYAAAHNMNTRLHNLIWEGAQPAWVETLKQQAVTSDAAKADLLSAIDDRIDYYVNGTGFDQVDVYNESWNDGELSGDAESYWQLYGAPGIAKIYHDAGQASPSSKMFINEFAVLQGGSNRFGRHVDAIQQAGVDQGFGPVIDGIGLQYYTSDLNPTMAANMFYALQNMNVRGLETALTEFGTFEDEVTPEDSAAVLNQALRVMFGNPDSTGFLVWDWIKEFNGSSQFATGASLYTVDATDWNTLALTPAGREWQDLLGVADWDGNPNDGWNTQLTATVGSDGRINFNGFYGDYELTVGGQTYNLSLEKGVTNYAIGNGLDGDFNLDGRVNAADYTVWRNRGGDPAEYQLWKANFGRILSGSGATAVPEPGTLTALLLMVLVSVWTGRNHRAHSAGRQVR